VLLGGVAFGVGRDSLLAVGRLPLLLATVGSIVVAVVAASAAASR